MKLACAGNCANTEDVEKIKERRLILSISWKFFQKMLLMFWGLKGILQVEKKWKYKMGRECNKWKGSNMVFPKNLSHLWSCCCSVAQLSQTFCNPMNRSTPVFPVLHHLPWFAQIHVHWVGEVMSNSSRPHGLQPTSLLHPWDFPDKHTGVGCHFLLERILPFQGLNAHHLCLLYCLGWVHSTEILFKISPKHFNENYTSLWSLPGGSDGKEPACNVGDLSSWDL